MSLALLLTVLRRRWLTVAVGAFVGVLLGLGLAQVMPTTYAATASLVVSPVVTNPFSDAREEVNIRTEQEILGSREVAARASEILGIPLEPDSFLLTQADIAAPSGSQVLQMTVQADSPQQAADAANALSQAYLEFRREGADATIQQYLERIDAQLATLQSEAASEETLRLISVLQEQRLNLTLTGVEPGRIIGYAEAPAGPSSPGLKVILPGGVALGVLLGVVAAIAVERLDRRVRSADRLARAVGGVEIVEEAGDDFWDTLGDEALLALGVAPHEHLSNGLQVLVTRVGPTPSSDDVVLRLREGIEGAVLDALAIDAIAAHDNSSEDRGVREAEPSNSVSGFEGEPLTGPDETKADDEEGAVEPDEESARPPESERVRVSKHLGRRPEQSSASSDGARVVVVDASAVRSAGRLERRAAACDVSVVVLARNAGLGLAGETISVLREAGRPVVVGLQ
jgi:capsular polysaccharide biosynthesis protein